MVSDDDSVEDRKRRAAEGRGAWRQLADGRDLVAELIAERRAEAAAADMASRDPDGLDRLLSHRRR